MARCMQKAPPMKPPPKIGPLERAVYNVAVAQGGTLPLHAVYQYGHRPLALLVEAGAFAKDGRGFRVTGAPLPPAEPPPEPLDFPINIRVTRTLGEAAHREAEARGEKISDFVRDTLAKTLADLGKERAGSATPGPRHASGTRHKAVRLPRKKSGGER